MVDIVRTYTANMTNITSPEGFLSVMNTNLNQSIGVLLVSTVFIVLFLSILKVDGTFKNSIAASSFICLLVSYLLWIINWVGTYMLIIFFIGTLIGVLAMFIGRE